MLVVMGGCGGEGVSVGGDGWVWRCVGSRLAGSDEWSVLIVMVGGEM